MLRHNPSMRRINRTLDNGSGLSVSSGSLSNTFSSSGTCSKELRAGVGVPDDKGSSRSTGLFKLTRVVDDIIRSRELFGTTSWMESAYLSMERWR